MALPPRVLMAVSKVSRVRSEAFSKNMTICFASSAQRYLPGSALTWCARRRTAAISMVEKSAMEQRSRPPSESIGEGGAPTGASGAYALLAMLGGSNGGWGGSLRRPVGKNLVECVDGLVDVLDSDDEWRQEAQDGLTGAVDEDAPCEHVRHNLLGEVGGVKVGGQHEALSAY